MIIVVLDLTFLNDAFLLTEQLPLVIIFQHNGGGGGGNCSIPVPGIFCSTESWTYKCKIPPPMQCSDFRTMSSNAMGKFLVLEQSIHCTSLWLTVTSDTSHNLRLEMSLCAFHEVFLSLMPVLILTVRGMSRTLTKNLQVPIKIKLFTTKQWFQIILSCKQWSEW